MSGPSWVRYGDRHGWMAHGGVPAKALAGATFWTQAARVTCIAEGGCVDMVQCYDAGIFTAGPLGATAAFGTLGKLLVDVPPNLREQHLGEMCEERCLGYDGNTFRIGLRVATADDLRRVFTGNADLRAWGREDPEAVIARRWVEAWGALLADPAALRGIGVACGRMLQAYLPATAATKLGFSVSVNPSASARRATATFLSFSINNPKGALRVLDAAGADADRMLDAASRPGAWPDTFPQRVARTRAALAAESW